MSLLLLSALNENRLWKTMFFYFSMHELCTITDYHTVVIAQAQTGIQVLSTAPCPRSNLQSLGRPLKAWFWFSTRFCVMSSQPSTVFRNALEALILVFHKYCLCTIVRLALFVLFSLPGALSIVGVLFVWHHAPFAYRYARHHAVCTLLASEHTRRCVASQFESQVYCLHLLHFSRFDFIMQFLNPGKFQVHAKLKQSFDQPL